MEKSELRKNCEKLHEKKLIFLKAQKICVGNLIVFYMN